MKIGLVRRGFSATGGAESYLRRFAAAANAVGHDPLLFTSKEWPKREWPFQMRRVKHGRSPLEFALDLAALQPRRSCDLLFSLERVLECDCYRAGDGVHAVWLQRRAEFQPKWRSLLHRQREKTHEILRLEETLFRGESASWVIANSRMVRDEIVQTYGYREDRVRVIYNGVPPVISAGEAAGARSQVRRELGLDENDYVLLFAGSGWSRKGLQYAIRGLNEAAVSHPTLLVAGSGARWQMPKSSRVRYIGPQKGLTRWIAAADVFVLLSLYDPFSNACLEAMTMGLPVITTPWNGFREIMIPGVEGEVVEDPRNIVAVAEAIERWAPPDRRSAVKEQLREKAARFSMEGNVRATLDLFDEIRGPEWAQSSAPTLVG